jgi:excisionase family DNA binding protein
MAQPRDHKGHEPDLLGLLSPAEAAAMLHVDVATLARWSHEGRLRAVRTVGGHRRYYATDVMALARIKRSDRRRPSG